jgi:hypothetical protein
VSTSVELSTGLLRKFAEFTRRLTPEQLEAIVEGTMKFGLLEPPVPKPPKVTIDATQVASELASMTSRDAASSYLDDLKLTVTQLRQLAKALGAPVAGAAAKIAVRDRIVEHTVGFRLNSQTIRGGTWQT